MKERPILGVTPPYLFYQERLGDLSRCIIEHVDRREDIPEDLLTEFHVICDLFQKLAIKL